MKKGFLLILVGIASVYGYSQVSLTVNVPNAGGLFGSMTATERNTVTDLTITGFLDARDFVTLRDQIPVLSILDISQANIQEYTGTAGTGGVALRTYPSEEIPYCAFWYNGGKTTLTQVFLPQTAHVVGMHAFQGCTGLIQANFPPSIDSIMYSAYHLCSGLIEINIPSTIQYIGLDAFARCGGNIIVSPDNTNYSSLDGVLFNKTYTSLIQCTNSKSGYIIPLSVNNVCIDAFVGCTMLETLIIPFSVENIESGAFAGCTGLTELEFPNTVHLIPYGCCSGCTSLQSVIIPESIDTISDVAFSMCTSLTSLNLPYSLHYIGVMTFWNCSALLSLNLPPQLSAIMPQAFRQCTSLESLVFPSSMSSLTAGILYQCAGLRKVVVPATISSIQSGAFFGCSSLEEFHANNPVPVDLSAMINVFQGVPVSTCILYVPVGSKVLYETAPKWQEFENIVEDAYAGIKESVQISIHTTVNEGRLWICGLEMGASISLYCLNGSLLWESKIYDDKMSIGLPAPGIYLLHYKNITRKIIY
jgi:hypothetical protein